PPRPRCSRSSRSAPRSGSSAAGSQEPRVRASRCFLLAVLAASVGDAKPAKHAPPKPVDVIPPRVALADQVSAEQATLATTIDTVQHKLDAADETRARRVLAAIRIAD